MPPAGEVVRFKPKLHHPERKVFSVGDPNNSPIPKWFYRDQQRMFGPFKSKADASQHLTQNCSIAPWMDAAHNWWWTDLFGIHHGPYTARQAADNSIFDWLSSDKPIDL